MSIGEVWSDLHHELKVDAQGAVKKVSNIDAILTSIDNILGTSVGERVMLPTFASGLKSIVFEPLDDRIYTMIAEEVKRVIETWDNRVFVRGTQITTDPDNSEARIYVEFSVRGYGEIFSHTVKLTR